MFPNRQESAAFRLLIGRQVLPFRTSDRAEQNRVTFLTDGHRFSWQRLPNGINGSSTNELGIELKAVIGFGGDGFEDFDGLCHDFWTDAITGEDCD
jgi:hypothetical protein